MTPPVKILNLLVVALLVASSLQAVAYDENLGKLFAAASMSAYCGADYLELMKCGQSCNLMGGYNFVHQINVPVSITNAVSYSLFYNPSLKRLVAAFRGTNNIPQLITESLDSRAVKCQVCTDKRALVEAYFHDVYYYNNLRKDFLDSVRKYTQSLGATDLYVTGHSLGGALATIATMDAGVQKLFAPKNLHLYTYGSPRVGNTHFVTEILSYVNEAFRIVHNRDIVPHVPPCVVNLFGLCQENSFFDETNFLIFHTWHVGTEVFYTSANDGYKVCSGAEDATCSGKYLYATTWIPDHLNYVGVSNTCVSAIAFVSGVIAQQQSARLHKMQ